MKAFAWLIFIVLSLITIGAVQVYCDEQPGKRRPPGYIQQTTDPKQIEIDTAYRLFWGSHMRDPFYAPKGYRDNEQRPTQHKRPVWGCNGYARSN